MCVSLDFDFAFPTSPAGESHSLDTLETKTLDLVQHLQCTSEIKSYSYQLDRSLEHSVVVQHENCVTVAFCSICYKCNEICVGCNEPA